MQEAILVGFALALLAPWLHRLTPRAGGWLLGLALTGLTAYLALDLHPIVSGDVIRTSVPWFPSLGIHFSFRLDGLSLIFGLLIAGMGAIVVVYASGYLAEYKHLGRLYGFLAAFMASMLGLVFADNLVTLFLFWELTSLTSYFLIGINHEQASARSAAWQALLVTGGGGLALLAGFILLGQIGGSYELSVLAAQRTVIVNHGFYLPMLLLIFVGAFTKSAQFPFHFWLPNAMAAPTPVSAYLHSATMVKAGVYLLARLTPTMGENPTWCTLIMIVGATTFAVGAALALAQTDLKRILAYSTVSVLGALTLLVGIGTTLAATAALLLLVAHAFYKAALFLVAGAVDHKTGTRDIRKLGGLARLMPITAAAALIATASGAGLPPLLGFLAKESMYEAIGTASAGAVAILIVAVGANALLVAAVGLAGCKPFLGCKPIPGSKSTMQAHGLHFPAQAHGLQPVGLRGKPQPVGLSEEVQAHGLQPVGLAGEAPPAHAQPVGMWLGPLLLAAGSLALGVVPGWIESLVAHGATTIRGEPVEVHLALWHGVNLVLILSVLTLAGGIAIYLRRERLLARLERFRVLAYWGPDRGYVAALDGLNRTARWQTRLLQSGYLRVYLMTVIVTLIVLVGLTLARGADSLTLLGWTPVKPYEYFPMLLIVCATVMAVTSSSRLAAVAALGAVGYAVALIFVLCGAPDLAMTQFAVETLTVIMFVLVLYRLPRFTRFADDTLRVRDILVPAAAGALLTLILLAETWHPLDSHLSAFFVEHSLPRGKGRNVVNVILVDFRGLDTLGEITVLAVAAVGIRALMKLTPAPKERA